MRKCNPLPCPLPFPPPQPHTHLARHRQPPAADQKPERRPQAPARLLHRLRHKVEHLGVAKVVHGHDAAAQALLDGDAHKPLAVLEHEALLARVLHVPIFGLGCVWFLVWFCFGCGWLRLVVCFPRVSRGIAETPCGRTPSLPLPPNKNHKRNNNQPNHANCKNNNKLTSPRCRR